MTKDELLWALVKALGIYFMAKAVLMLGEVLTLLLPGDSPIPGGWIRTGPGPLLLLVYIVLRGGVGWYLLSDGSWLLRMARRKGIPADPSAGDTEVST